MPQDLQNEIDNIIEEINKVVDVNKIYLFGSYAYGNPKNDSDLDLCILTNNNDERKRDLIRKKIVMKSYQLLKFQYTKVKIDK